MKPYELGMLGFKRNKTNPFTLDTFDYKEWERGYNSAYFENLEKVRDRETREGS